MAGGGGIKYFIVLVPMTQDDYKQLMRMFGVPFRSVDTSVSGYMVNMHMKQARLVYNLAESSFEWKFFYAMVYHGLGSVILWEKSGIILLDCNHRGRFSVYF